MTTLTVRLGTATDAKARLVEAGNRALAGQAAVSAPTLDFGSHDDMHRVPAPSRHCEGTGRTRHPVDPGSRATGRPRRAGRASRRDHARRRGRSTEPARGSRSPMPAFISSST